MELKVGDRVELYNLVDEYEGSLIGIGAKGKIRELYNTTANVKWDNGREYTFNPYIKNLRLVKE